MMVRYTAEEKEKALAMMAEQGGTKTSKELGIAIPTLYAWRQAVSAGNLSTPVHKEKKSASKPKKIHEPDANENTDMLRTLLAKEDDLLAKIKEQEAEVAHLQAMKITIIHGQNHKGSSYHVGRILAEKLANEQEITEFFLPRDLNHFCLGCCVCITDEKKCPFYSEKKRIADAMEQAEILIFTTPTYCMECSAPMKAFIDLFFQYWLPHRPRSDMFSKKAVVISTAAGAGMGKAIAPIKRTLAYWGVPYRKGYGIAVRAAGWEQVPEQKRGQIEKDMSALAEKVKKARVGKPSPLIRFMFLLMASAKKSSKEGDYDAQEARYWRENGWLNGKRPWR